MRFAAALVVDSTYLVVWTPMALVCIILQSYRSSSNVDTTHPDYYMHVETTNDPFSNIFNVFNNRRIARSKIVLNAETPLVSSQVDDVRSEFQKAMAASRGTLALHEV
jgi:hypothetical protein